MTANSDEGPDGLCFLPVGRDVIADFEAGDIIELLSGSNIAGEGFWYGFEYLDSNGNGVTDDGDEGIAEAQVVLNGVSRLSTVIDIEVAAFGDLPGISQLVVWGVTGLIADDFYPSGGTN
jgi:hypothetical protein